MSVLDLRDWKAATTSFTTIAGVTGRSLTVTDGTGEPERYLGARMSWDLFRLLGTSPMLGRDFLESDDQPNAAGVVLLSHVLWTTRYRSDPQVLGRRILIDGSPHTVVGVMPPELRVPGEPAAVGARCSPGCSRTRATLRYLFTFGRLAPGREPGARARGSQRDRGATGPRLPRDQRRMERAGRERCIRRFSRTT